MTSPSPFMDDYSSEEYSSSDDESFEFADDDYLLIPAEAEDQPIDDHENQPADEGAQIPDLETSTDFMTRRDEPTHIDWVSDAVAVDKAEVWMEGFAEVVEDSDDEREMSDVKEVVANDVEVHSEHEADNLATLVGEAALAPEVLMELAEAAIEKYAWEVSKAADVEEDEAVIDEPSDVEEDDGAVIDEPAVGEEEDDVAVIDEPAVGEEEDDVAVIDEPAVGEEEDDVAVIDEPAVGEEEDIDDVAVIDEPAVGESDAVAVVTEVGFVLNEPAVGADDVVAPVVTVFGFMIDEPAIGEDDTVAVVDEPAVGTDEPSEEFESTVAPQPAASDGPSEAMIGESSSDEIESSGIEDYIAEVERFADEITGEYTSEDVTVNHAWCSRSGAQVQSPEFDFMYEFANWTTSTPVVVMQELVTTLQSYAEIFLRELIRLRSQVSRFICSLFEEHPPPADKSA